MADSRKRKRITDNLEYKYSRCSLQTQQSTVTAANAHGLGEGERRQLRRILSTPSVNLPQDTPERLIQAALPIAESIGHTLPPIAGQPGDPFLVVSDQSNSIGNTWAFKVKSYGSNESPVVHQWREAAEAELRLGHGRH